MGIMRRIAIGLILIGAINWGLIGFFKYDLVASLFGGQTAFISRIIYALVGLSGLACLGLLFRPMEEEEPDVRGKRLTQASYSTEFGEEPDFKKPYKVSAKKSTKNHSAKKK